MKFYKKQKSLISLVCGILLIIFMLSAPVAAADTNSVTATTSTTVWQGNSAYCYVDIDSTEGLAALDVTVHYDPAKVKINNIYNSVSYTLYDSVINTDNIQFSYIMDGQGTASKTSLFFFEYQVLGNADVGDSFFDITVGEAYDNSLNEMEVSGSRCRYMIAETVTSKSCYVYGTSHVSTAIEQEFTLDYCFSDYEIASGTAVITYDSELFEVVEVTNGNFLNEKLVDINTELAGEIYISFVGTEYYSSSDFVSVTFRTIKNITDTSQIVFKATELNDKELNSISCSGYTTSVSVMHDETYKGDYPAMRLDGILSYEDNQITLVVSLEENSHLGAGDFVINFDPKLVTYNSCTKGFAPSFFNINDKNVEEGELKFHIISLSDIVTEETVLTVVFDVNSSYACKTADFTLDGTGLTDSLTEDILLNFIDDSVLLEYQVTFLDEGGTVIQSGMYHYGDVIKAPSAPTKASDNIYDYVFSGWDKELICNGDMTITAEYKQTYIDYTVVFKNWDGTELSKQTYHYGDVITVSSTPAKASDNIYDYVFLGWDKELICKGDMTITAEYTSKYIDYTVVFKNWDGTELSKQTYHYGDAIKAPSAPTKASDNIYDYVFLGWDKELICNGNMTITAEYTSTYIDYTVVFKNWDGTKLSKQTYHYGDKITAPSVPNKASDNIYSYVFSGWDKELICNGNMTITAEYTSKYIDYTVVFENWDGTKLSKQTYHYGDAIKAPSAPTKASDNIYDYVFSGWDKELICDGNMIITAEYTSKYIDYTVVFENWDGTKLSKQTYHYGDAIKAPSAPTKASDNIYDYVFSGWDKELICNGNMTITAEYKQTYIDYAVVFKNWDGTKLSKQTYHYGDTIKAPVAPTKASDNIYSYVFSGWDKELICDGNMTITAEYTSKYIDYTVVFKNWDGTELSKQTYHYGDAIKAPSAPTKASDNIYDYVFLGWDKELICNGNMTITAEYTSKYIDYTVVFKDWDGTELSKQTYHYGDTVQEPDAPTKESDVYGNYIFNGWDKKVTTCTADVTYTATYALEYKKISITSNASSNLVVKGDKVTISATAEGGYGDYTYSYIVYNKDTKKWARLADNISSSKFTWKAGSAGNRVFYVDVKDTTGKVVRSNAINVKVVNPLRVKATTTAKEVVTGGKITIIATVQGGIDSNSYTYSFIVYNKDTKKWSRLADNIKSNTFTWKAKSVGNRVFYVDVKDSTGKVVRSEAVNVSVVTKLKELGVTASASETNVKVGNSITFKATATGGSGVYTYSVIVYNKDTKKWARVADNITSNTFTWKAKSAGNRTFYVDVKDSTGKIVRSVKMDVSVK